MNYARSFIRLSLLSGLILLLSGCFGRDYNNRRFNSNDGSSCAIPLSAQLSLQSPTFSDITEGEDVVWKVSAQGCQGRFALRDIANSPLFGSSIEFVRRYEPGRQQESIIVVAFDLYGNITASGRLESPYFTVASLEQTSNEVTTSPSLPFPQLPPIPQVPQVPQLPPSPPVPPAPQITVSLLANNSTNPDPIDFNTAATLSWTSSGMLDCSLDPGNVSIPNKDAGSQSTGNLTNTTTFSLNCQGYDFQAYTASVEVRVNAEENQDRTNECSDTDPGKDISTACDVGTLNESFWLRGNIGPNDSSDTYKFYLPEKKALHVRLTELEKDADMQLYNNNWESLAKAHDSGLKSAPEAIDIVLDPGYYYVKVYPYSSSNRTPYKLSLYSEFPLDLQGGIDPTVWPAAPDYSTHVGQDYYAPSGTPVWSPVEGKVIIMRPADGYGTMVVTVEVTLPEARSFVSVLSGRTVTTNKVLFSFGHLRPSEKRVQSSNAWTRFNRGKSELSYDLGDTISVGDKLGYLESWGYNGSSSPHVHITACDGVNRPSNIMKGKNLSAFSSQRAPYIRAELAWPLLK